MPKNKSHILVVKVKRRMKTDECIKTAQRIETHLDNEFKVLVTDKNVEGIHFFEVPMQNEPKEEVVVETEQTKKGEKKNGKSSN